jgi:serine-type D-Ala-D-Ala carboxypeptidase/endopeptidase (penicillin-binding protein 4)
MLDYVKSMAWRMLAAIGHGGPSLLVLTFAATLASSLASHGWPAVSAAPPLNGSISWLVNDPCFHKGQKSIRAVNLTTSQTILDINGDALLIPASTTKLVTSATALLRLSPHYRFRTVFLSSAPVRHGVLEGDLYLKGYGDPVLVLEEAWLLARGLRKQGVQSVRGDLIGDDSYFDKELRRADWPDAKGQQAFNAKIGALSVHFNSVSAVVTPGSQPGDPVEVTMEPASTYVTIRNTALTAQHGHGVTLTRVEQESGDLLQVEGSLTAGSEPQTVHRNISHPSLHATTAIFELLQREGVQIAGRPRTGQTPPGAREVYVHQSKSMYQIIDDLHKYSNNFIAEQILKTLGAETYGPPGSWGKGLTVVAEVLESLGIRRGSYTMADGSGLSRLNRLSAAHLVTLLMRVAQDFRVQAEYLASLLTPGGEGHRSRRFQGSDFAHRARVKTGSLEDVSALAGYVGRAGGEIIAFAVLLNGPLCSMEQAWQLQDAIVERLIGDGR